MRRKHSMQYTVRNVPASVDDALKKKARRLGKSLNWIARDALLKEAGIETTQQTYHDLDDFFGSWIEDPEVDRALAEQDKIDPSLWR